MNNSGYRKAIRVGNFNFYLMKKYLMMAVMALFAIAANAQAPRWGIKAGLNFANLGRDANTDARVGFHIGGLAEWKMTDLISLQPEALLSMKGADDISAWYLEVPINAKFNFELGKGNIYLTVGPYIGIGLFGEVNDYDWFGADRNKRFDIGGGLGVGYEFAQHWFVNLGYSYGFMNINDTPHSSIKYNQMNCNLSFGYKF